jgi:hypothetical protein
MSVCVCVCICACARVCVLVRACVSRSLFVGAYAHASVFGCLHVPVSARASCMSVCVFVRMCARAHALVCLPVPAHARAHAHLGEAHRRGGQNQAAPLERDGPTGHGKRAAVTLLTPSRSAEGRPPPLRPPRASPSGRTCARVSEIAAPSNTSVPWATYTAPPARTCTRAAAAAIGTRPSPAWPAQTVRSAT